MVKENLTSFTYIGHARPQILWPERRVELQDELVVQDAFEGFDDRTRRMLEFLLNEEFKTSRASNKLRVKLATWVIQTKIYTALKRALDIILAVIALILLSPIFLITALAIKIDSRGPIIYKQTRVGKRGKHFICYKFRSMVQDADRQKESLQEQNEADEIVFKIRRDPRITKVGRIIRKLSIDELPQIFNVLQGDMSIVGPRPPVPIEVEEYQFQQYYRLDAIPGITGLQQIKGRSDITFKRWVQLDLEYIQEQSIWKDIEIILKTIPAVISGKGAY